MPFQKEFDTLIGQVRELEQSILALESSDIIPLAFFSSSIDYLNRIKASVRALELAQFRMMQEHLERAERDEVVEEMVIEEIGSEEKVKEEEREDEPVTKEVIPEEPEVPSLPEKPESDPKNILHGGKLFLADAIAGRRLANLSKSLSLNDRFMFRRDIFRGSEEAMNQAFDTLNRMDTLEDSVNYLNENYLVDWESPSGALFRDMLEKRFV